MSEDGSTESSGRDITRRELAELEETMSEGLRENYSVWAYDSDEWPEYGDMTGALVGKLEPKIVEAWSDPLKSDPETLRQVVDSIMGVKIPGKTSDDMVMETISDDPTLRREWADTRLHQMKRNGRSEMDIVGEGLDMHLKILQES